MADRAETTYPQVVFALTHTTPGGLREIWQDVAQGLSARGLSTGLLALYPQEASEADEARRDGWQFIAAQPLRRALAGLGLLRATVAWLRQHRPAAIITAMPMSNVLFPLAATLAGVRTRVILSHHTPSFTYQAALNRIDKLTGGLPCVASIVSVSDAVGTSFERWPARYRAKQRTIHNALPERIEAMVDAIAAGHSRESAAQGLIVAVGRLSRQKNHPQLIRAMALLPRAKLEIIGAGEEEAELRALIAELNLQDRVSLPGQMPREEALRRAAQADIFAQVSLFEGTASPSLRRRGWACRWSSRRCRCRSKASPMKTAGFAASPCRSTIRRHWPRRCASCSTSLPPIGYGRNGRCGWA
jgi:glycosyltransferase involved in cell wall biosynthesis